MSSNFNRKIYIFSTPIKDTLNKQIDEQKKMTLQLKLTEKCFI